jgi:hypothetical protein
MTDESAEVARASELASLRAAVHRLEHRATWHTVANLLTLAVAAGALALPFLVQRLDMKTMIVKELRVVDNAGTVRARLAWDRETDETKMVMLDAASRSRFEVGTAADITVLELLPANPTAGLRMQVGEEDVMIGLRHEPEGAASSRLDLGVHRELVQNSAVAGPSTLSSSVASGRVALHLARSSEGLHVADLDLDSHGPTLELRTERAGRARLHVPASDVAPEMLVEDKGGATARLTPGVAPPSPPPSPAAVTPTVPPPPTPSP